jgi:hypothetical protein
MHGDSYRLAADNTDRSNASSLQMIDLSANHIVIFADSSEAVRTVRADLVLSSRFPR